MLYGRWLSIFYYLRSESTATRQQLGVEEKWKQLSECEKHGLNEWRNIYFSLIYSNICKIFHSLEVIVDRALIRD